MFFTARLTGFGRCNAETMGTGKAQDVTNSVLLIVFQPKTFVVG